MCTSLGLVHASLPPPVRSFEPFPSRLARIHRGLNRSACCRRRCPQALPARIAGAPGSQATFQTLALDPWGAAEAPSFSQASRPAVPFVHGRRTSTLSLPGHAPRRPQVTARRRTQHAILHHFWACTWPRLRKQWLSPCRKQVQSQLRLGLCARQHAAGFTCF